MRFLVIESAYTNFYMILCQILWVPESAMNPLS